MATAHSVSSLARRLIKSSQTSRSIGIIGKRVHANPHIYYTRPITHCQGGSITQAHFNQPFMSSPPNPSNSEQPSASIGMEWEDLSAERKIQWLLHNAGDTRWGWVVYRSCYKPEFDAAWESVRSGTEETARQRVATSDAPGIAEKMNWVFVEDREQLDGASRQELKRRFRDWARAENPGWKNIDEEKYGRGSRYTFFIQVDEPALRSIATGGHGRPYVNIVRGWEDDAEMAKGVGAEVGDNSEDWMKIQVDTLNLDFYVELNNDEAWYTFYTPPTPNGICSW